MPAPSNQRSTSNSRGRRSFRTGLGSRKTRNDVASGQEAHARVSNAIRARTSSGRRSSLGTAPWEGQQTTLPPTRGSTFHQHLKRPHNQTRDQDEKWKNPASLNAAFQSHAGKVANSREASWRISPFDDPPLYIKQMNDYYQNVCV